ncbi:MAG TPA: glycosyltransferase family 2 protein [Stenotrophobium sp.]|jgi:glycosyltransferase involved in cell wall biosynthesis|nr:glycosyltransferase family 2 protein [Stenotrophobium sp.]
MTVITPEISIVIPCHNEQDALAELFGTLCPIIEAVALQHEILVINDGSSDDTLEKLLEFQKSIPQLRVIDLSRNFGKEAAVAAGLAHCRGRCAILLDADLQDPPDLIPQMLSRWREGYETVIAVHAERSTDTLARRTLTDGFYRLLNTMSRTVMPANAGDFRLLDRVVIDAFLSLPERTRFNKGLFAWIGFRQCLIEHQRPLRSTGTTKFTYRRLVSLAIDAITSFSSTPLRLSAYVGGLISLLAFIYGGYILLRTLIYGNPVPGYASIFVAVTFLGGINLLGIGILGEYIGRIFVEAKQRPLYVIRHTHEPPAVL